MNFEYTEEQIMAQQSARDFAQRELILDVILLLIILKN